MSFNVCSTDWFHFAKQRYIKINIKAMQQKVQNFIDKYGLLPNGAKIIVGVSGGADSVVLLHLLHNLGYNCIIAHCNFHLRMEESDRDELFVRKLAQHLNINCQVIDFNTIEYASLHKISIEMAARELRYKWFEELRQHYNADAIAVAHHSDDSIETMLMNLVRGTGIRGLIGIPSKNGFIVRPLLCCSRNEIENYLTENNLEHVEDSTNNSNDYTRNKFRNEIIPLLEIVNPSVRQTLSQTIQRFEGVLSIYQQSIDIISNEIVHKSGSNVLIDIEKLLKQEHISTILYEILYPFGFHSSVIEQIERSIYSESGKIFYSETHSLLKDRNYLIINANEEFSNDSYILSREDEEILVPVHLKITRFDRNSDFQISKNSNCIHIDENKLKYPLYLRHWNEGDYFYPFGMNQRKKLSDFFTDQKMNIFEKKQCWLLTSEQDIVWIMGIRIDNRFRITESTTNILQIEIEKTIQNIEHT